MIAIAYATAYLLNISVLTLWPQLLTALIALAACAAYVSVVNDITDLNDDLAAGKPNRLVGKARTFAATVLTCCILPGVAVAIHWRGDPLLLSLYLASWVAFTLYSLPPFRLKGRGLFGLLADACGAHLFPSLLAACLVYRASGRPVDRLWAASVAAWALSLGARGILWHQLTDSDNDERIGLRTFARRHKLARLRGLGNFVIFPAELCAFAVMLWRVGSLVPLALLCFYALLELARAKFWGVNLVVVVPKQRFQILMLEYYELFFPLALLASSSARHPADAVMIAAQLLLFPRRAAEALRDCELFIRGGRRRLREIQQHSAR